ncbi:MAG: helix-turn-helix domain-containing protein [Candidatus Eremiobacterota bacterium]
MQLQDDLLSPMEVSEILKVSKRTVLRWLENGKLRGIRVGSRLIKIPRNALNDIICPYKQKTADEISYEDDPFLHVEEWVPSAVENSPEDLASEHDHYLYNLPKRK